MRAFYTAWTELKINLRTPGFWVVALVWAGFTAFNLTGRTQLLGGNLMRSAVGSSLPIITLLLIFYTSQAMWREKREGSEDIWDSMPASNTERFIGKVGGLFLTLLIPAITVLALVTAVVIVKMGMTPYLPQTVSEIAVELFSILLFALTISVLPGVIFSSEWLAHIVALLAGIGLITGGVSLPHAVGLPTLGLMIPFTLETGSYLYSDLFGSWPFETETWLHHTFWIVFAAALLAVSLLLYKRVRIGHLMRPALVIGLVLLVLTAGIGLEYHRRFRAKTSAENEMFRGPVTLKAEAVTAAEYDIDLETAPRFVVRAVVTVQNDTGRILTELPFVLRDDLRTERFAVSAGGSRLSVATAGDFVTVRLPSEFRPGESMDIEFTYSGKDIAWIQYYNWETRPDLLAGPRAVVLAGCQCWYPVPGFKEPAKLPPQSIELTLPCPADFSITVVDAEKTRLVFASNLAGTDGAFSGRSTAVSLLGLPFAKAGADDVTLLAAPGYDTGLSTVSRYVGQILDYYEEQIGLTGKMKVAVVPYWIRSAQLPLRNTAVINETRYSNLVRDAGKFLDWEHGFREHMAPLTEAQAGFHVALLTGVLTRKMPGADLQVIGGVAEYLYEHWAAQYRGGEFLNEVIKARESTAEGAWGLKVGALRINADTNEVALSLERLYQNQGSAAVQRVLTELFTAEGSITVDDLWGAIAEEVE